MPGVRVPPLVTLRLALQALQVDNIDELLSDVPAAGCLHALAEEVRLVTGDVVAAVCPTCLEVLPAAFVGSHWKP